MWNTGCDLSVARARWCVPLGLLAAIAGCGAEAPEGRGRLASSAMGGSVPGTACGQLNATQACSCGAESGAQRCDGNGWLACECRAADDAAGLPGNPAGNLRSDIHFLWDKTPRGEGVGDCPPGDYEGNFLGIYYSYIASASGAPGLGVPIANLDLEGGSGLRFTLEPAQGGETTQKVRGVMEGTADGVFPFGAQLSGELDCKAGTFVADMSMGTYSVLIDGLAPQLFEGVMTGRYDHRTHTFVDGTWDVWETSAMPPGGPSATLPRDYMRDGYGGSGEWAAALPTNLSDPTLTACAAPNTCKGGALGPNKLLCGDPTFGPPACLTDADCNTAFPGQGVTCLKASAFSICLRECKP